jgi:hypothetical protein
MTSEQITQLLRKRYYWIRQALHNPNSPDYHWAHTLRFDWDGDSRGFERYILENLGEPWQGNCYLHRINQKKGWVKNNLTFAHGKQMGGNKRNAINIKFQGRTQCKTQWSEEYGVNYWTLNNRLNRGWKFKDAVTTPAKYTKKIYGTKTK